MPLRGVSNGRNERLERIGASFSEEHEVCLPTNHFDVIRRLAHGLDPEVPLARLEEATRQRQARFDYALTTRHRFPQTSSIHCALCASRDIGLP
jgi:hypothetical protein